MPGSADRSGRLTDWPPEGITADDPSTAWLSRSAALADSSVMPVGGTSKLDARLRRRGAERLFIHTHKWHGKFISSAWDTTQESTRLCKDRTPQRRRPYLPLLLRLRRLLREERSLDLDLDLSSPRHTSSHSSPRHDGLIRP